MRIPYIQFNIESTDDLKWDHSDYSNLSWYEQVDIEFPLSPIKMNNTNKDKDKDSDNVFESDYDPESEFDSPGGPGKQKKRKRGGRGRATGANKKANQNLTGAGRGQRTQTKDDAKAKPGNTRPRRPRTNKQNDQASNKPQAGTNQGPEQYCDIEPSVPTNQATSSDILNGIPPQLLPSAEAAELGLGSGESLQRATTEGNADTNSVYNGSTIEMQTVRENTPTDLQTVQVNQPGADGPETVTEAPGPGPTPSNGNTLIRPSVLSQIQGGIQYHPLALLSSVVDRSRSTTHMLQSLRPSVLSQIKRGNSNPLALLSSVVDRSRSTSEIHI